MFLDFKLFALACRAGGSSFGGYHRYRWDLDQSLYRLPFHFGDFLGDFQVAINPHCDHLGRGNLHVRRFLMISPNVYWDASGTEFITVVC